ncbi:hypothetical protein WICPIJ_006149 [Wickerhamomyces pijperi]|uniref:Nucleoporin n=1 Tax=Wickerhamomyces pijperi TaxID=599730 RepID=A0A9P8TKG6_WICPI|nr:hypothetical protein WICPIJ_006149 [Wickerhamomyces pijperi]
MNNHTSTTATTTSTSAATTQSSSITQQPTQIMNENDTLSIRDVDVNDPLQLSGKFIDASLLRDRITPILNDPYSLSSANATQYNFSNEFNGLGAFTPFERTEVIPIPDEILMEYNQGQDITRNMGIFAEIGKAWVSIDNKLILWNFRSGSASSSGNATAGNATDAGDSSANSNVNTNSSCDFQTFEDIQQTILKVQLVKPTANTFTESINYLLLISTVSDIHILAVSFDPQTNELELYNTDMSVSTVGLTVDQFISHEKTGKVFFTGLNDGLNIWELQYSNKKSSGKVCLTRSTVSNLIPGSSYINSMMGYFGDETHSESVKQLLIDQSRSLLYTLSNTSVIRMYRIMVNDSTTTLSEPTIFNTNQLLTYAKTSVAKSSPLFGKKYLPIVSLSVIPRHENEDLYLIAITCGGLRVYLGNNGGSFYDRVSSSLRVQALKFPPTKVSEEEIANEQRVFKEKEALKSSQFGTGSTASAATELPSLLMYQKRSSILVESKQPSVVLTPGIFFSVVSKAEDSDDKLFASVPDYGILKYHNKTIENATFLESFGKIHEIVPLAKPFNATDRPQGYSNEFATQYDHKSPYEVAVLTNTSLQIYQFRTPAMVFETLTDDFTTFVNKFGLLEAASTALYVSCKYNISKTIRSNAFNFFTMGVPNVIEWKPIYRSRLGSSVSSTSLLGTGGYSFSDVVLSPRFYGTITVIGRLFREIWNEKVFQVNKDVKFGLKDGVLDRSSLFENEFLDSVNIGLNDLEFYLSSISVLNEFFQTYGNSIACFISPANSNSNSGSTTGRTYDKAEEFANQSENIAFNAAIRLIISIKEALSFLSVLMKEGSDTAKEHTATEKDHTTITGAGSLKEIFKYLPLEIQQSLAKLTFKEIFTPTEQTKNLIREILSSIINRNMSYGESIEYIAKGLQEQCGSFCSGNDVVGFKAMEHLRKAKEIGLADVDGLNYHLDKAMGLFEVINNEISLEKLKESVDILVSLHEFPRALKFVLNISNSVDVGGHVSWGYVQDGKLANDERAKVYLKRHELFEICFSLLQQVDSQFKDLKEISYQTVLEFQDQLFHYELYDWFISQGVSEILLDLSTAYVLPYLEEKSGDSQLLSDLLWLYQSKRGDYYSAALISYSLSLSDFNINLTQRNEYLSRAIGFCNCVTLPHQRQQMIQLNGAIEEVFQASNVQYDLLMTITGDSNLDSTKKKTLIEQLNGKILTVSELFNDYANVLSYHEICLLIYKVSDFRNSDEILSRWVQLFENLRSQSMNNQSFVKSINQTIISIGKKLCKSTTGEFVFPIVELFPMVLKLIQESSTSQIQPGSVVQMFLQCDISFDKLYYVLRDLLTITNAGDLSQAYQSEMCQLIELWYDSDVQLRLDQVVSMEDIKTLKLKGYSLQRDPIASYMERTGNSV